MKHVLSHTEIIAKISTLLPAPFLFPQYLFILHVLIAFPLPAEHRLETESES